MKNKINRYIFTQTQFESSALTQLGFVVHQFNEEGLFQAEVFRHGKPVYGFEISISKKHKQQQISVDLEKLNTTFTKKSTEQAGNKKCACDSPTQTFELLEGGYGLFFVGSGAGGYSVRTSPVDRKTKDFFDSTLLGDGDLFGITLLKPGKYAFIENTEKTKLTIEVEAVKPDKKSKTQYVPPEPVHLDGKNLKKSKVIKLRSAQGLIYRASGKDSISIELTNPNDKDDKGKDSKVAHWNKVSRDSKGGAKPNR